jgi:AcrR family transcriptional regulator
MDAAVRVIVTQGLSAPTALIAKEAGISNGSLFTYFETKSDLYNQLYLELKTDIAAAALKAFPEKADLKKQVFHIWSNWMAYAAQYPEKRRAMAQLNVSEDITPGTRAAVYKNMAGLIALMEEVRLHGPMKKAPMNIASAIITSLFEATMDTMIQDPANAKKHSDTGFEAFWRVIG